MNRRNRAKHKDKLLADSKERRQRVTEFGIQKSKEIHAGRWPLPKPSPNLKWKIFFSYPFSFALSKNSRIRSGRDGTRFVRPDVKKAEDDIILIIKSMLASRSIKVEKSKLWITIFVEKPTMKGDAINVIDTICDAIKKGVKLDDNWVSLCSVDWAVVKHENPKVFIEIGQEMLGDQWPCNACGEMVPFKQNDRFCDDCKAKRKRTP